MIERDNSQPFGKSGGAAAYISGVSMKRAWKHMFVFFSQSDDDGGLFITRIFQSLIRFLLAWNSSGRWNTVTSP